MELWYKKPSASWVEALPVGNGRLGAMVFGDTVTERLALNEDTLWSGYPKNTNPQNKKEYYYEAMGLVAQREYPKAQRLIEKELTSNWTQSYLPIGDLYIKLNHDKNISGYRRNLDLNNAIASVEYEHDGTLYKREVLATAVEDVIAVKLCCDKPQKLVFEITFDCKLNYSVDVENDVLVLDGLAPSHVEPSYSNALKEPVIYLEDDAKKGMKFCAMAKVTSCDGEISYTDTSIKVSNATNAVILINAKTSFIDYKTHPYLNGYDYKSDCLHTMQGAQKIDYNTMKKSHIEDYEKLFNRVELDLGENELSRLPTDERLYEFAKNPSDNSVYTLLFEYGRYLLISSSREGTQAANLQGIWNEHLRAPWSSNYTLNINTEMNYWHVFSSNLLELHQPLIRLIQELCESGEKTAKETYGVNGFVSHHNTDIWRISSSMGNHFEGSGAYAFWQMSSGWLCRHLFEQYEYTLDKSFLKSTAYPIMKKAAEFFINVMIEDNDGVIMVSPTTSPENTFIFDDAEWGVAKTTTMSNTIVKELFNNCIKCCDILDVDEELRSRLEQIIDKMYPYEIGSEGQLLEWNEEFIEADPNHRHISHLYGLHPANEITMDETPMLAKACEKSLDLRGDDGTGWSLGWKVNQWARLKNGDRALNLLRRQLRPVDSNDVDYSTAGGTYINMFDAHPPFQIDGNFAATAGICEMLLRSYNNKIILLPALPSSWNKGSVKGLVDKGAVIFEISWDLNLDLNGRLDVKHKSNN